MLSAANRSDASKEDRVLSSSSIANSAVGQGSLAEKSCSRSREGSKQKQKPKKKKVNAPKLPSTTDLEVIVRQASKYSGTDAFYHRWMTMITGLAKLIGSKTCELVIYCRETKNLITENVPRMENQICDFGGGHEGAFLRYGPVSEAFGWVGREQAMFSSRTGAVFKYNGLLIPLSVSWSQHNIKPVGAVYLSNLLYLQPLLHKESANAQDHQSSSSLSLTKDLVQSLNTFFNMTYLELLNSRIFSNYRSVRDISKLGLT